MINVKLPDGSEKQLDQPISGLAFAESISKSLSKKAVAIKIDGILKDLSTLIDSNAAGFEINQHICPPGQKTSVGCITRHQRRGFLQGFWIVKLNIGQIHVGGSLCADLGKNPFETDRVDRGSGRLQPIVDNAEAELTSQAAPRTAVTYENWQKLRTPSLTKP